MENFILKATYEPSDKPKETRRFAFPPTSTFQDVIQTVAVRFYVKPEDCSLEYCDEDGDLISVDSDAELRCAFEAFPTLRVTLKTNKNESSGLAFSPTIEKTSMSNEDGAVLKDSNTQQGQEAEDHELALKLQNEEKMLNPEKDTTASPTQQELDDLAFAQALQAEDEAKTRSKATMAGAAILGAGVGMIAGGALMALAGAGIGAVSASEEGRKRIEDAALRTGRSLSELGRRINDASENHGQRVRAAASEVMARVETRTFATVEPSAEDAAHATETRGARFQAATSEAVDRLRGLSTQVVGRVRTWAAARRAGSGEDASP